MAEGRTASRGRKPDLKKELRDFASARPQGWSHDDWLEFLENLQSRGHNVNDREAIGRALERERLDLKLSGIEGVGPKRRYALVEHYGNLWTLRNAAPDEIARTASMPRPLGERVKEALT